MPSRQANIAARHSERLPARVPVHSAPSTTPARGRPRHRADHPPAGRRRAGERRDQRVVLPAAEHPCPGVGADRRGGLEHRVAIGRPAPPSTGRCRHRDASAMCRRSATRPSETSVIARRARLGRDAHPDRRAARAPDGAAAASSKPSIPLRHNAYPAADRPRSPATATTSTRGRTAARTGARPARSPSTVTETTHCGLLTRSPPTMPAPDPASLVPHAVGQLDRPARRACQPGAPNATTNAVARSAHRLDVGGVLRDGFSADVMRRRPVQPKVPAFDQHVGGHHDAAVARPRPPPRRRRVRARRAAPWRRPATNRSITANSPSPRQRRPSSRHAPSDSVP